ncbi:ComF family protein [Ammoniphilus sp. YIM 78166]|uniref:ComF family protein n=1 Tax=Ammoniphilus sp. YIM 78166 TaxID=1644106 RepID=UPI00106F2778|nr:ComF family protein [Ammoniphilus sp. YIM 78166]
MRLITNLLFPQPSSCALCERKAAQGLLCRLCQQDIEMIDGQHCERCGRPHEGLCDDCVGRPETFFVMNRSAVRYNEKMKEVMSLYKFRGQETLAPLLADLLIPAFTRYYSSLAVQAITFVPIHEQRLKERGFNQAQQLAFLLSLKTKVPVINLLERNRMTEKQSKQHRSERLHRLEHAFSLRPNPPSLGNVLLVDDVYTTGSTVNECARALAKAGMKVYSLTVAR